LLLGEIAIAPYKIEKMIVEAIESLITSAFFLPDFSAIALGIRSVPTVVLFKGDRLLEKIVGLKPKKLYAETIQKSL